MVTVLDLGIKESADDRDRPAADRNATTTVPVGFEALAASTKM